jgi:hypothetical protein
MTRFSRFLAALHRHRAWGWAALILYACAVTFPHELVQQIVGGWAAKYTLKRIYWYSAAIAFAEAGVITLLFARRALQQSGRLWLAFYWLLTLALMVATWRVFFANNTELVHYPQYFPEGIALLALTLSPVEALAWVVFFGLFDETFQYVYVVAGRALPLDFNDIYMDLLGGAAGVLFAAAWLNSETKTDWRSSEFPNRWKRILTSPGVLTISGIILATLALLASGKVLMYEAPGAPPHWFALSRLKTDTFWYFSPVILGPHHFHELAPLEGTILILATIALYAPLERILRK